MKGKTEERDVRSIINSSIHVVLSQAELNTCPQAGQPIRLWGLVVRPPVYNLCWPCIMKQLCSWCSHLASQALSWSSHSHIDILSFIPLTLFSWHCHLPSQASPCFRCGHFPTSSSYLSHPAVDVAICHFKILHCSWDSHFTTPSSYSLLLSQPPTVRGGIHSATSSSYFLPVWLLMWYFHRLFLLLR